MTRNENTEGGYSHYLGSFKRHLQSVEIRLELQTDNVTEQHRTT